MPELLDEAQRTALLATLPHWTFCPETPGCKACIKTTIQTGNFLAGLALVTKIAVRAEQADHHPDVLLTYPRVQISLSTHDAGGITAKDIELARDIDRLR